MNVSLNKTTDACSKKNSLKLRGTIENELGLSDSGFSPENVRTLRHHGIFQQDNRDERGKQNGSRHYQFMVRIRATGGKLSARQLQGLLELTGKYCDGKLHITSRQGMQLSGIEKSVLRPVMNRILDLGLTTLATGGNFGCNIMCGPMSQGLLGKSRDPQIIADEIDARLAPRVQAYDEIWRESTSVACNEILETNLLNGSLGAANGEVSDLPQKFKIGLATADDNCTEVYAQDVGLLAATDENGQIVGYNVLVGGNMRNSTNVAGRAAALAIPLAFVDSDQVVSLVDTIVNVYRKHGNREDHSRARLKYLIQDWGMEQFKQAIEEQFGPLEPPRSIDVAGHNDHLGWQCQDDKTWSLGIRVENGCIDDEGDSQLKSALQKIMDSYECTLWLTPQRNILIRDIDSSDCTDIDTLLENFAVPPVESFSNINRYSASCPGLPSCSSAITESHRILPGIIAELEAEVLRLGLGREQFSVRVAGCSFGCTRSQLADIGIIGRTVDPQTRQGKYAIFLGGDRMGERLNKPYKDLVPEGQIVETLRPLLVDYCCQRLPNESLGDFFVRTKV